MHPDRIRWIVRSTARVVAFVILVTLPISHFAIVYREMLNDVSFKARLNASRVAKYVYANSALWEFHGARLAELIEFSAQERQIHRQIIQSAAGREVFAEEQELAEPTKSHREPVTVNGKVVGWLIIETSLLPLLVEMAAVIALSLLLAFLVFISFDRWPLRLINRALGDLQAQQANAEQARRKLELSEAELRERTEQLVQAQELGQIGDWSLTVGEDTLFLSPVAASLLRLDPGNVRITPQELKARMPDDFGAKLDAMIESAIRHRTPGKMDIRFRRGDDTMADLAVTCRVADTKGARVLRLGGTIQDITERVQTQAQLEKLAYYDPLTGLPNRSMFQRVLNQALQRARQTARPSTLLLIDLDRFKEVNDSLGHATGDELLIRVSQLLNRLLDSEHFVARLGGDEFAIIIPDAPEDNNVEAIARAAIENLSRPMMLGRAEVLIGASIGIAVLPLHGTSGDEIIKNADLALYRAKDHGRGRFVFFEPAMNAMIQERIALARDLRAAVASNDGLEVWLQPQIDIGKNGVNGFEALMRWNHPTRGFIPPSDFIPIAESSSLICDLGLWILRESARMAKEWIDAGGPPYEIAVNVSAAQIWQTNMEDDVGAILKETGLPPHLLILELTESLLADHAEGRVRKALNGLKSLGVKLALDDFGTGYSSLGYLIQLPFDKLKIDRIFVAEAPKSAKGHHVLQGIIALGRGLGMTVVAEGVERPDELALLREFGCDQVQGYIFARPAPAAAAFAFAVNTINGLKPIHIPASPLPKLALAGASAA